MKLITLALVFFCSFSYSQEAVDLMESTLKLEASEEKEFYFGFAEGDQILIDFQVEKGRFIHELEISDLNKSAVFSDFKVKKIKNKSIRITSTGIYKIKCSNHSNKNKSYRIHIKRIPKNSETQHFNSTVYWKTVSDTISKEKTEKYLVRKDTSIVELLDQTSKVHSYTNLNSSKNTSKFKLPKNTVSWAYYIDVNQSGQASYEKATKDLARLSPLTSKIPGFGPVAAIALGLSPLLPMIQGEEDVNFYLTDYDNVMLFLSGSNFNSIRKGLVTNTYGKMQPDPNYNGYYYICLENDNAVMGITVIVKVVAIVVTEEWGNRVIPAIIKERKEGYLKE